MKLLKGRVAVVTGAGSGIGRATAVLLGQHGCRLAISDIDTTGLEDTRRLVAGTGANCTTHVVDVSERERMQSFADEVQGAHGGVNVLVNNAGVAVSATFAEQPIEDFEWLMATNFWGVIYGCKSFLPLLLAADQAHIVNVSSVFGLIGVPRQSAYCASKFALRGFSEALRAELAPTNVRVTCVHPGGVATNIAAKTRVHGGEEEQKLHQQMVERFRTMLPPEKAARAIVRGILRDRPRVLITRATFVVDLVQRASPSGASALLDWSVRRAVNGRAGSPSKRVEP